MKPFELAYLCLQPFLPAVNLQAHLQLLKAVKSFGRQIRILDVGGRKSHYTIGISADITILDLPRQSNLQTELNLGINHTLIKEMRDRRSNVKGIVFGDMTSSPLQDGVFDCIVAIEVLEHVEHDTLFLREVHRVLKPQGLFVMTTPNGDFIKNEGNPDHKRHYTMTRLQEILFLYFPEVRVEYSVRTGIFHKWGLISWSIKAPARTALGMLSNSINNIQSSLQGVKFQSQGTGHLIAVARRGP